MATIFIDGQDSQVPVDIEKWNNKHFLLILNTENVDDIKWINKNVADNLDAEMRKHKIKNWGSSIGEKAQDDVHKRCMANYQEWFDGDIKAALEGRNWGITNPNLFNQHRDKYFQAAIKHERKKIRRQLKANETKDESPKKATSTFQQHRGSSRQPSVSSVTSRSSRQPSERDDFREPYNLPPPTHENSEIYVKQFGGAGEGDTSITPNQLNPRTMQHGEVWKETMFDFDIFKKLLEEDGLLDKTAHCIRYSEKHKDSWDEVVKNQRNFEVALFRMGYRAENPRRFGIWLKDEIPDVVPTDPVDRRNSVTSIENGLQRHVISRTAKADAPEPSSPPSNEEEGEQLVGARPQTPVELGQNSAATKDWLDIIRSADQRSRSPSSGSRAPPNNTNDNGAPVLPPAPYPSEQPLAASAQAQQPVVLDSNNATTTAVEKIREWMRLFNHSQMSATNVARELNSLRFTKEHLPEELQEFIDMIYEIVEAQKTAFPRVVPAGEKAKPYTTDELRALETHIPGAIKDPNFCLQGRRQEGEDDEERQSAQAAHLAAVKAGQLTQFEADLFQAACALFAADPSEIDPAARLRHGLWKIRFMAHQWYGAAVIIKQLKGGWNPHLLADDTGLGKTLLTLFTWQQMITMLDRELEVKASRKANDKKHLAASHAGDDPCPTYGEPTVKDLLHSNWILCPCDRKHRKAVEMFYPSQSKRGCTVIIVRPSQLGGWLKEIQRSLHLKGSGIQIWVAYSNTDRDFKDHIKAVSAKILEPKRDAEHFAAPKPGEEDKRHHQLIITTFSAFEKQIRALATEIRVKQVRDQIESKEFTTPQDEDNAKKAALKDPRHFDEKPKEIDILIKLIILDEFHTIKGIDTDFYSRARTLGGNPDVIALSATPWEKSIKDIIAVFSLTQAYWYQKIKGMSSFILDPNVKLSTSTKKWLDRYGLKQIVKAGNAVEKASRKDKLDRFEQKAYDDAVKVTSEIVTNSMLARNPDSLFFGQTMVKMPHHDAFLLPWKLHPAYATTIEQFDLGVFRAIAKQIQEQQKNRKKSKGQAATIFSVSTAKYFERVRETRILKAWPAVSRLTIVKPIRDDHPLESDGEVYLSAGEAHAMIKQTQNHRLWSKSDEWMNTETNVWLKTMLQTIDAFLAKKGAKGRKRQLVVMSTHPWVIAPLYWYFLKKRPDLPVITMTSTDDAGMRSLIEDKFQARAEYGKEPVEIPRILLGSMPTVSCGFTFSRADVVLFADPPFTRTEVEQAIGRVNRVPQVQDAAKTTSVMLYAEELLTESGCVRRHNSRAKFNSDLKAAIRKELVEMYETNHGEIPDFEIDQPKGSEEDEEVV